MIIDYFMITEKSNQLQVIVITDYNYPNSGDFTVNYLRVALPHKIYLLSK